VQTTAMQSLIVLLMLLCVVLNADNIYYGDEAALTWVGQLQLYDGCVTAAGCQQEPVFAADETDVHHVTAAQLLLTMLRLNSRRQQQQEGYTKSY